MLVYMLIDYFKNLKVIILNARLYFFQFHDTHYIGGGVCDVCTIMYVLLIAFINLYIDFCRRYCPDHENVG